MLFDLILVIWIWKLYHDWFVAKCRDNLIFESICCEFETGCIDTWMTAKVWFLHDILVDQKLDFVFMLIHQSHDADRSGSNIKIFFHIFWFGKGQSGRMNLCGQIFCFKWFISWHK